MKLAACALCTALTATALCGVHAQQFPERPLRSLAKSKPAALSYGSAGSGSVNHLLGVMLNSLGGVNIVHVPYRGAAAALTDPLRSGSFAVPWSGSKKNATRAPASRASTPPAPHRRR